MKRTNIYLDEHLDRLLRYLALEQGRSFTDLVREVLLDYVKQQGFPDPSRVRPPLTAARDHDWTHFNAALERLRANVSADIDLEELESDIDAAVAEVRAERRAQQAVLSND